MKRIVFTSIIACLAGVSGVFSQTVNNVPIKEIDVDYVEIIGTSKLLSRKMTIELDFGQRNKAFTGKDTKIKDKNGKLLAFNSMIDALNFMSKNGYEFVNAYVVTADDQSERHYVLKRKQENTL